MKIFNYNEIGSAITILFPSIIALYFIKTSNKLGVYIASFGVILHCPFSFALHLYKAFGSNVIIRTKLYKLDAIFIHIGGILTGISWALKIQKYELFYHILCIFNLIFADPIKNPRIKNKIDILTAIGIVKSTFGIFYKNYVYWCICILFWINALVIHNKKLAGQLSSSIMHILLALPQFLMLATLNNS
jgi:hypothetical protein